LASLRRGAAAVVRVADQPLTFVYSSVLLGTTLQGRRAGQAVVQNRLQRFSSDGHNLRHAPIVALAGSALFVEPEYWILDLLLTALAMAAFERRVGTRATATVFAAGHVGATLATQLPVITGVERGVLPADELRRIDVGSSFGVYACLGAMGGILEPDWQRRGMLALAVSLPITGLTSGDPVAAMGHPIAVLIGMAFWPWLRRRQEAAKAELAEVAPNHQRPAEALPVG
jgi:hypothetical protein